jgi:hypothetical protein
VYVEDSFGVAEGLFVWNNAARPLAARLLSHGGRPFAFTRWPRSPGYFLASYTGYISAAGRGEMPVAEIGLVDVSRPALLPATATVGVGIVSGMQSDAAGRVWLSLPWSGTIVRVTLRWSELEAVVGTQRTTGQGRYADQVLPMKPTGWTTTTPKTNQPARTPSLPLNGGNSGIWANDHFGEIDPGALPITKSHDFYQREGTDDNAPFHVAVRVLPRIDVGKILGEPSVRGKHHPLLYQTGMTVDADGGGTAWKTDPSGQSQLALAYKDGSFPDPTIIPYVVLPQGFYRTHPEVKLGDVVAVFYQGRVTFAIYADEGGGHKIGEASMRTAQNVGIDSDPVNGGTDNGVTYLVFPGSGFGNPLDPSVTEARIQRRGAALLAAAGGRP